MARYPDDGRETRSAAVDVIVLSWERANDTIAAVESTLGQQGVIVTAIVVDQGSSEATLHKLRAAFDGRENVRLHQLGYNSGCARGRNIASQLGSAEFVAMLDNDATVARSDGLANAIRCFRSDSRLGAMAFRILNAHTGDLDPFGWGFPRAQLHMAGQPFLTTRLVGGGSICRRDVLEEAGGFDENLFFGWEDVELGYRIVNLGYTIRYNPSITIIHKSSLERRQSWSDQRYYHYVKGRLYLEHKYGSDGDKLLMMAAGYLIRGIINRHLIQACSAIRDAAFIYWRSRLTREDGRVILTEVARNYIRDHETKYRGSLWLRLRTELLARLPDVSTKPK